MTEMNKNDFQLFQTIAQMRQDTLLKTLPKILSRYYKKNQIIATEDYILCGEGEIPIMLVAHLDTVFKTPPERIFYDVKQHTMWSPQGLGADDRAGVFSILKIIQSGLRPSICFTTEEEHGSLGARALIKAYPKSPFDLKYIIEMDRQGTNDCVFYDCDNPKFTEYIEHAGFITDWGTFSDISEICPAWGVAGVNLSVGYKNEHNPIETLNTDALYSTIKKTKNLLVDADSAEYFEYIPDKVALRYANLFKKYGLGNYYEDEFEPMYYPTEVDEPVKHMRQCFHCHKLLPLDDVFPVKAKDFDGEHYYCLDCVTLGINWCEKCGEPFEVENEADNLCPDCAGKQRPRMTVV